MRSASILVALLLAGCSRTGENVIGTVSRAMVFRGVAVVTTSGAYQRSDGRVVVGAFVRNASADTVVVASCAAIPTLSLERRTGSAWEVADAMYCLAVNTAALVLAPGETVNATVSWPDPGAGRFRLGLYVTTKTNDNSATILSPEIAVQ